MKYIIRGIENEVILKLNSQPINTFSGTYLWNCKHIQTNQILTLILTDSSIVSNVYQKFIIDSGDSQNFLLGQYEVRISDVTASTQIITTEYFTAQQSQVDNSIYFMANSDTAGIYQQTSTAIPDVPQNLQATVLPTGIDIKLTWKLGSSNTDSFELWRKTGTGGTFIGISTDIQSFNFADNSLQLSTIYFYKLRAKNSIGFSAFTPEVSALTSFTGQTGGTTIVLIGSGETITTHISGNTWNIYSPFVPTGGTGNDIYTGATPAAISVGGIVAGETLTGKTYTKLFEDLLVPTLYPNLTAPFNSFVKTSPSTNLYEIAEVSTINFTAGFNRGSIIPAYGTNGYRSGVPSKYNYTGTGLPATNNSSGLTDNQSSTSYVILQGNQSWTSDVSYNAGQQPKNSKGGNYDNPLASGTTGTITCTIEGVYPIFCTTVTIATLTKQPLVSMLNANNLVYSVVAETGGNKQSFEISDTWLAARPLVGVQTFNTVSNQWEYQGGTALISLTYWTTSADTQTIQSNVINYTKYTYNGVDRATVQIKLIF